MAPASKRLERIASRIRPAGASLLALALLALLAGQPAGAVTAVCDLAFSVLRDGASIGSHQVDFRREGDDLHVKIAIDLEVGLGFITLFSYRHRNHEVWRDGRLVRLDAQTDDDGTRHWVKVRAAGRLLEVESDQERYRVAAATLPTSYWNPDTIRQRRLINTQTGVLAEVAIEELGAEQLRLGEKVVEARRYRVSGDIGATLWYAPSGDWVGLDFTARGSDISYAPRATPGELNLATER